MDGPDTDEDALAQAHGFSLQAAVAAERLTLTARGDIRYALKTPYRDGTMHVVFEPMDFLSRLAALVPSSRGNLTRFNAVFAPRHALRSRIVPVGSAGERAASQV